MAKYRDNLPQLNGKTFLTDGGLETILIFHEAIDLPYFAAFDLLKTDQGRTQLGKYFRTYAGMARDNKAGIVLESPTWRASSDWGEKLGYSAQALAQANHDSIALLEGVRAEFETADSPMVISGCIGPRGDGYQLETLMSAAEAEVYHAQQITSFTNSGADLVSAFTMTHTNEAIGISRAAQKAAIPVVISFTLETDGRLPSGQSLKEAIETVDAATNNGPVYYMINCAHPSHFTDVLADESWLQRIHGVRANASSKSHAELDESVELDDGNPVELGGQYRLLGKKLSNMNVVGGCCGTDHRHVAEIYKACA